MFDAIKYYYNEGNRIAMISQNFRQGGGGGVGNFYSNEPNVQHKIY